MFKTLAAFSLNSSQYMLAEETRGQHGVLIPYLRANCELTVGAHEPNCPNNLKVPYSAICDFTKGQVAPQGSTMNSKDMKLDKIWDL